MKKLLLLITLVSVMLLLMVPATSAQNHPSCKGLMNALEKMPSDSPGYKQVLANAQERCGEALDRAALVALYHSTDGDNWINNEYWLDENVHHCSWYGVTCCIACKGLFNPLEDEQINPPEDEQINPPPPPPPPVTRVHWIHLDSNHLSGSLPPEIGYLACLYELDLSGNQLSGTIPPELDNMKSLTQIDLSGNQLSGTIPPELGNLSYLNRFNLSANALSGAIPKELSNLNPRFFREFWLDYNQLDCWETAEVLQWAKSLPFATWDYPYPGEVVCTP